MKIERRFTQAGKRRVPTTASVNSSSAHRASSSRTAGWSFECEGVVRFPTVLEPGRHGRLGPEVLPQGGRPHPAADGLGKGGPELALAVRAGHGDAQPAPAGRTRRHGEGLPAGLPPSGGLLDLLGHQGGVLRHQGRRAGLLRRDVPHARPPAGGAQLARSGSTPACTGPTASTARRRATTSPSPRAARSSRARTRTRDRSRTRVSSAASRTTSSARAASWTSGCARRGCSSTAPAPAPTSARSAGRERTAVRRRPQQRPDELPQDRRPRRRRDQVRRHDPPRGQDGHLDIDHPDIENFINWKVREEQKVAALVAGSRLAQKHLNAIMQAPAPNADGNEPSGSRT